MKAQRAVRFLILIAVLIGIIQMVSTRDPRYRGRSLTSWLQQCSDAPLMEPQRLAEAQAAVRAIGVKRALPKLLSLVETKENPISLWIMAKSDKFHLKFPERQSAEHFQQLGVVGFQVFGTNAAPAVGELAKLLDDKDHSITAMRCLSSLGKPSEAVLCRALTNRDESVRKWSIDGLASVTDDVEVYIARIKGRLKDSSDWVRVTAVDDIGIQTSAPELAVPLLVAALKESSDAVSSHAADSLAHFGTNALQVFPNLRNLVENGSENTASAALKTMVIIAPDRSLAILTNCIARGRPASGAALRALADTAPEKALPIILDCIQSSDPEPRRVAFTLLCRYPMTSQIESAMQTAAVDSDSVIAGRAKEILTDKYQKEHPLESHFLNEPGYGGKSLGEWLKTHDREGAFPEEARQALRQMGTNAIPSLLNRLVYVRPPFGLPAFEVNTDAMRGFIMLGEYATPALPKLQALMDGTNPYIALEAMVASCGTGSNAIPFLIIGLTNEFPDVRNEAANLLAGAVGAKFPEQREQAIPLFVELLNDPDEDVRMNARNELKEIDPRAAAKAGIK